MSADLFTSRSACAGHPRARVAERRRESPPRDPAEGERGPQEAGRAALVDEEALLPLAAARQASSPERNGTPGSQLGGHPGASAGASV